MNTKLPIILQSQARQKKSQLCSLKELKSENIDNQDHFFESSFQSDYPEQKPATLTRFGFLFLSTIGSIFFLIVFTIAYLTSPLGEKHFTQILQFGVNYLMKPYDCRISITALGGFWKGRVRIVNLRVFDAEGQWLHINEGTIHPQWSSLVRSIVASWRYKRNQYIPDNFFVHYNTSTVSLVNMDHKSHSIDFAGMPFTLEENTPKVPDSEENIPKAPDSEESQIKIMQTRPKNTSGTSTRKNILNVPAEKRVVNSLLNAEDILDNKVVLGFKTGTLINVVMTRFPKVSNGSSTEKLDMQNLFSFLPKWLAIDVGELELAEFQLGARDNFINFSARLHGQISNEKLRVRTTLLAAKKIVSQWVLPAIVELPDDVMISVSEINNMLQNVSEKTQKKYEKLLNIRRVLGYASFDYDQGNMDIRWQMRDSLFIPFIANGIDALWTRARILAHVPAWPPNPQEPLQARFATRYGVRLIVDEQVIPTSTLSGQIFWDNDSAIVRDLLVQSPLRNPNFVLKGSGGFSRGEGFGSKFTLSIHDVQNLVKAFGFDKSELSISGSLLSDFSVTRGGEHLFWWAKPLPKIEGQRQLPGFYANPHDGSVLAKSVQRFIVKTQNSVTLLSPTLFSNTKQLQKIELEQSRPFAKTDFGPMPIPSKGADGLLYYFKVESPNLKFAHGQMKDVFISLKGNSVHGSSTPEGLAATKKNLSEVSDFTKMGLPRGLLGKLFIRCGNIFNQGVGVLKGDFFVNGAHEESKAVYARFFDTSLQLPGIDADANMIFSYALPIVKRRWPWLDGDLDLKVQNWNFISALTKSSLRITNANLYSTFKSVLDKKGRPFQTFIADVGSERLESRDMVVKQSKGTAQSNYLHSLADSISLAFGSSSEARTRKRHYTPPEQVPIFTAKIILGNGRGGPIRWSQGTSDLYVIGEDANFTVRMLGELNALLEGAFHFRTRTLNLKEMKLK